MLGINGSSGRKKELREVGVSKVSSREGVLALAAYHSGQLAEGRFDFKKAMKCYRIAASLEEDNPKYVAAANSMACILGCSRVKDKTSC